MELKPSIRLQIDSIKKEEAKRWKSMVESFTRHSMIQQGNLLLKNRATNEEYITSANFIYNQEETRKKYRIKSL